MDDKIIVKLLRDAQRPTDLAKLMDEAALLIEQQSKELQQLRAENNRMHDALAFVINNPTIRADLPLVWNMAVEGIKSKLTQTEPQKFAYASSAELFRELGASPDEAEKQEREIEAIVRRTQIREDNKP